MPPSVATSVVSAAVISGDLILGLSTGDIINCGRVQGPQGLKGDQGPVGSTGRAGLDGNTIHTVQGTPDGSLGRDGDYAINTTIWEIYGPRAGGRWGTGTPLRGNIRGGNPKDRVELFGTNPESSGGGGGGLQQINGGDGIKATKQSSSVYEIEADIDQTKGLTFEGGKIAIKIESGLEFDAFTGELKTLSDVRLPYRIETDKVLRDTKEVRSGEAEIHLVDNEDNYSNIKFAGTNGVDVTSTASSIIIDGSKLAGDITADLASYATIAYSDGKDANLQNQIDELSVSRGKVARYEVKNITGAPVSRPGEMSTNNPFWSNVIAVSFGIEDLDGAVTKPIAVGDIIDFVDSDTEKLSRYRVSDAAGAPTGVGVEYVSGNADFAPNQIKQVYIYPQNEAGASKEYVDAQDALKLDLAGGTLTGPVIANSTLKINGDATYNGASNEEESLVNRKYVDDAVNTGGDFLPITGGRMLGNLEFGGSAEIKATGTSSLDNRVSLNINAAGGKPVGISSGSSFESALSIFGYDSGSPNNRKQVINLKGNGGIEATGSYVGQLIKSIRNTGYAFEAKPDDVETTALIRTNGSADFTNKLTLLKVDTANHAGFTIKGTVNGGTEGNLLQSYHNSGTTVDAVNYDGKIESLTNIVNKGYVDAQVGPKPAQLAWIYDGDKPSTNSAPADGKFYKNGNYLRFSFKTNNGVDLSEDLCPDTGSVSTQYGSIGVIWYYATVTNNWKMKRQFRSESWRWNYNGHFEFELSSSKGHAWSSINTGTIYHITIGGWF